MLWNRLCVAGLPALVLFASTAFAQVRAPQGNTLPDMTRIPTHVRDATGRNGEKLQTPENATPFVNPAADAASRPLTRAQHWQFAQEVNLSPIRDLAVFNGGRVTIVDTVAREELNRIYGQPRWHDAKTGHSYDPVFTYLDLIFDKAYYANKPIIDVQVLTLRRNLVDATVPDKSQRQWWLHEGRVSPLMIMQGAIRRILTMQNQDLRESGAIAQVMQSAWAFNQVGSKLKLVSPLPGSATWARLDEIKNTQVASADASEVVIPPMVTNPEAAQKAQAVWKKMAVAWRAADATTFNHLAQRFAGLIKNLNPSTYPSYWRRGLEHFYNMTDKMTVGWVVYFLATVTMLLAFMIGRRWVIGLGIGLLLTGFAIHAFSIATRAILAQRWPIDNQYESFIAITFFAVLAGIVLMWVRKQWMFGAAAGALGTAALLMANLVNIPSNNVERVAGILATSTVLYLHVDTVLFAYAMLALGFFLSLFYLFFYYFGDGGNSGQSQNTGSASPGSTANQPHSSIMLRFAAAAVGKLPQPALAAAGVPDSASESQTSDFAYETPHILSPGRQKLLLDLDKAQLVVLQIGFWLLGTGVLLGAYWANHAWGRWWGWDPKETWALITWIIYLIALHVRYGVKRRGLSTAWLSVVGFFIMLWTYWGVNLLIAGLHSYA